MSSLPILGDTWNTSTGRFSHSLVERFGLRMCFTTQLGNRLVCLGVGGGVEMRGVMGRVERGTCPGSRAPRHWGKREGSRGKPGGAHARGMAVTQSEFWHGSKDLSFCFITP